MVHDGSGPQQFELGGRLDGTEASAYGGPGWSPRTTSLREEIGSLWGRCGVDCEWTDLKAVLLHEPGMELSMVADPDRFQMLDGLDFRKASSQHRALGRAFQEEGVWVRYLRPEMPTTPNQMFVADLMLMTPEGAIVARPASTVRAGEERLVAQRLAYLGIPILFTVHGTGTFEGADALWLDPGTVMLATGLRTNREGADQVAGVLRSIGADVIGVELPQRSMHLMGLLRIVDRHVAVAWSRSLPASISDSLRARGWTVLVAPDEGLPIPSMPINFVTLGPRRVLMPGGFARTRLFLEEAGVACQQVEIHELGKAAGGIGCLTGILERSPAV